MAHRTRASLSSLELGIARFWLLHVTVLISQGQCFQWILLVPGYFSSCGFPGGAMVKNLPAGAGDTGNVGSIPGSARSPGVGNGNQLHYSCLENPMDRGA